MELFRAREVMEAHARTSRLQSQVVSYCHWLSIHHRTRAIFGNTFYSFDTKVLSRKYLVLHPYVRNVLVSFLGRKAVIVEVELSCDLHPHRLPWHHHLACSVRSSTSTPRNKGFVHWTTPILSPAADGRCAFESLAHRLCTSLHLIVEMVQMSVEPIGAVAF